MPVVKKGMFSGRFRPNCQKCGKFVGEGGYYSVTYDYYNGGYEEDDSLCKKCYQKEFDYHREKMKDKADTAN